MGFLGVCNGISFIEVPYRTLHYPNKKALNVKRQKQSLGGVL